MHDTGIVHGDLVPSNLYLKNNKVGFFGILIPVI